MARKVSIGARVDESLSEQIKEAANRQGITMSEYIAAKLENDNSLMDKQELKSMMAELLEELLPQYIQNQEEEVEEYDPYQEYHESGETALDVAELVTPMLAEELNCLIGAAHEAVVEAAREEPATPYLVLLFEMLAKEAKSAISSKTRYECATDYRALLENEAQLRLSEILATARNELGPAPGRYDFLTLFVELLEDQAESILLEAREISFSFDRDQWRGLDLLLNVINRSRGEEEQFEDLPALVLGAAPF